MRTCGALWANHADGVSYFVEKIGRTRGHDRGGVFPATGDRAAVGRKSNEFSALLGGRDFEPHAENPMIGLRVAANHIHPVYAEGFAFACRAIGRVCEQMGLTNLELMRPFHRRLSEAHGVLATMAGHGLVRGVRGQQVYVMCEVPSNVLLIDALSQLFEGYSIGSNDLTQLTLGVDRDSAIVADSSDEQDPGMLKLAVEGAIRNGLHSGICGQALPDLLEVARYLLELGIDSISLTPDRVLRTMQVVMVIEQARPAQSCVPAKRT
jgi:pyruvate,water dikinase